MQSLITLLFAGLLLVLLLRGAGRLASGDHGRALHATTAAGLGVALVLTGLAFGHVTDVAGRLKFAPQDETVPPNRGIDEDPRIAAGIDGNFMRFLTDRIPADGRFTIVCEVDPCDDTKRYLVTVRLPPRVPVKTADEADWIVFLGVNPTQSRLLPSTYADVVSFGEGMAVARTVRATP